MKVNIGVVGRFHAFDLAKELNNNGILNKLITTMPKFKVRERGIENNKIISKLFFEVLNRYRNKIPFIKNETINEFVKIQHGQKCSKYLSQCDIHIGWSGSSLETIIEAKKQNKITILERGSSHYTYQMNILEEENKKYGNGKFQINYSQWQRELLEYELADYISIPSSFVKRTFMEYGVAEHKLLVNPYGVDLSQFKQIKKEDDTFRVIFCGNLSIQKGSHYLLEAISELKLDNFEFWHIGGISKEIKPFIEKYKASTIIYKGSYPQHELYKLYSQGSVFILPSIQDGFGMVIFQAMACGLPVILSENTGAYDVVSKNGEEGFVIPIRSTKAIKEKILYLYNNPSLCQKMGEKAKKKVSNSFSWDDYGKRYIENLEKIMENNY